MSISSIFDLKINGTAFVMTPEQSRVYRDVKRELEKMQAGLYLINNAQRIFGDNAHYITELANDLAIISHAESDAMAITELVSENAKLKREVERLKMERAA